MPFQITCSSCKNELQIPDKFEGKKVQCRKCTFIFLAKKAAPPPPPPPPIIDPLNGSISPPDTRVFISHAVADQHFVDSFVHQFFKSHNIDTWYCAQDIQGGSIWLQQIMDGLNKSDWFVLVLSPRSVESQAVRKEVELAFETKRGRILPILMEKCSKDQLHQLHPELPGIQYEDFTKNLDKSQGHLLVSMVRQLSKERNELEQKSEHQSQTAEDLKAENGKLTLELRGWEDKLNHAATFDGNWSDVAGHGKIPNFCQLKTRRVPIVAVCNFKGGAGKTTLTANLGATLWTDPYRKRVLLIDLDYQGSLSGSCLDPKKVSKLEESQRFVQELFRQNNPDSKLIIQLASEVTDEKTKNHEAFIIAANENLAIVEAKLLFQWMMQDKEDIVDVRYLLRHVLHTNIVPRNFDIVLLDCPPRMTAAAINAFLAADFLLIPTPLEQFSTEAVPRLLKWVRVRRQHLLCDLNVLGVVVSRTKNTTKLLEHEKELLDQLKQDCQDAWGGPIPVFDTCIPTFQAVTTSFRYPAQHLTLREVFGQLLQEMMPAMNVNIPMAPLVKN